MGSFVGGMFAECDRIHMAICHSGNAYSYLVINVYIHLLSHKQSDVLQYNISSYLCKQRCGALSRQRRGINCGGIYEGLPGVE